MSNNIAIRDKFRKTLTNKVKFFFYFLLKLPSVIWWGIRLKDIDDTKCTITIPYSWRTQNPFKSVYFGAQSGAAELSTGLMILSGIQTLGKVSFLVTGMHCTFHKKAKGKITFVCEDGKLLLERLAGLTKAGDETTIDLVSRGFVDNVLVSEFTFGWSLKKK